jgi:GNAT superfamily N-acetyltransferase
MEKALLMGQYRAAFPDNGMRSTGKNYYEWKIYKNPIMEGFIYLEERDGRIVGSSTLMPRRIAILDKVVLAAEWADSFTLPEYRRQGINSKTLIKCKDYAVAHGMDVIYGPPNEANYQVQMKLGCRAASYIGWAFLTKSLNRMGLALRLSAKIILGRDVRKNLQHLVYLARMTGSISQVGGPAQGRGENGFQIVEIDRFRNRVDPLWGEPRYSFFVVRDADYLNWRYFDNPDRFTVLAAVRDGEYLGYVALKMAKNNRTAIMCDFVSVNDRPDVFALLVGEAEKIVRRNGAEVMQLRCIADSSYYTELKKVGYYDPGPERYHRVVIYGGTELGRRILENPGKWHFTYGDTDEV